MSPYDTSDTNATKVVMGKAFVIVDDPQGSLPAVNDGDEIKDMYGNLSLSSQRVLIIPQ